MSEHLRCETCGGSVVYDVTVAGAACLFCGDVALTAVPAEEIVPEPVAALPFVVDTGTVDGQYRAWARRSWFYPKALRTLSVHLHPMFLPAWRFDSDVETHWAGLRKSAQTNSGKSPVAGENTLFMRHMVPASAGLSQSELIALMPFDERTAAVWNPDEQHVPWEPPALSEHAARISAHEQMAAGHGQKIAVNERLLSYRISPVVHDRDVALLMLPIYIGVFRFRDRPWRFVVNAQSGEMNGEAPIDRLKIALIALSVAALAALVAVLVT